MAVRLREKLQNIKLVSRTVFKGVVDEVVLYLELLKRYGRTRYSARQTACSLCRGMAFSPFG